MTWKVNCCIWYYNMKHVIAVLQFHIFIQFIFWFCWSGEREETNPDAHINTKRCGQNIARLFHGQLVFFVGMCLNFDATKFDEVLFLVCNLYVLLILVDKDLVICFMYYVHQVKLMEERNMKPLDSNLATLSTRCNFT